MLRGLLIPVLILAFAWMGCEQDWEKKKLPNAGNNTEVCWNLDSGCPPCPVEMCACAQDPPDCELCRDPILCPPQPDGGTDVQDIVQPDIPDSEPDPHLYMVECAALEGGGLPGYLTMFGTWYPNIYIGISEKGIDGEWSTSVFKANLDEFVISSVGRVQFGPSGAPLPMVVDDSSGKMFFITNDHEYPVGCDPDSPYSSSCRYNNGVLWSVDLITDELLQESSIPLESETCRSNHGTVFLSAIDFENQWLTLDCELFIILNGTSYAQVAYETYRIHLVTGEIQYLFHAEERLYVPTVTPYSSGHDQYRFTFSHEWATDGSWTIEPIGYHIWDLSGAVPVQVYEQYYPAGQVGSGHAVAIDGWFYWSEFIGGHLQIRGLDLLGGGSLTTSGTDHEKGQPHPVGRNQPHLVSYHGGSTLMETYGMVLTGYEGIYLWDKELDVIRKATTSLPFTGGVFFNGTDSTRWFLLLAKVGDEPCLFVRDLHAAGVVDPLTNRLLPEPEEAK